MATILVVDDEPQVSRIIASALEREGRLVLVARSGSEALAISKSRPGPVDLLLSHVDIPDMDGVTLARGDSMVCTAPRGLIGFCLPSRS